MKKNYVKTVVSSLIVGVFLFMAYGSDESENNSNSDSYRKENNLNNNESNSSGDFSKSYCSKHSQMYLSSNGCHKCMEDSWKEELEKPGGFRDRVSRP